MADEDRITITHWAILIGINFYMGDEGLQGSVRDVQMVKKYLEAATIPVDIAVLTATTPSDPRSQHPVESPDLWPTVENVIAKLQSILGKANPGYFVYIHYSGHGTRRKGSDHQPRDLALVLFDDTHSCSYLIGEVLAGCLRNIVAKELLVTVVLDCYYSGRVLRVDNVQGVGIRAIEYMAFD